MIDPPPDIGACYCHRDAPDRCRWDDELRRWVGPCWPPDRTGPEVVR